MELSIARRMLPVLAAAGGALLGSRAAHAQAAASTWDQIMQTRRLRVGAADRTWYFKDTANGSAPGGVRSATSPARHRAEPR